MFKQSIVVYEKSNYDKFPVTMINGNIMQGWSDIRSVLEGKIKKIYMLLIVIQEFMRMNWWGN